MEEQQGKSENALAESSSAAANETKIVFTSTKIVGNYFAIDDEHKLIAIGRGSVPSLGRSAIYRYDEIISYELIEDGASLMKGGVGRAIGGGLLFGNAGAIVGGISGRRSHEMCMSLAVKITVDDMSYPMEMLTLISSPTDKTGQYYLKAYTMAQEILSLLEIVCRSNDAARAEDAAQNLQPFSTADEIRKYHSLFEEGIITADEFEAKKKQLLGL